MNATINMERLKTIEDEWEIIEKSYRVDVYQSPINLKNEKQKFHQAFKLGEIYNPQFNFATPAEFPIKQIHQYIVSLDPDESWIEKIYFEIASRELLLIQSTLTHDPNIITGYSALQFGLPGFDLLKEAQTIINISNSNYLTTEEQLLPSHEVASQLQTILDRNNLQDWEAIVFEPMNARMMVDRLDKKVKIRKGENFSLQSVRRLIVHEIGVHVLRYFNGSKQNIKLFQRGLPGYLDTEEGLAVYSEEKAGLLEFETLRKYAGRVIAAHLALNQSFVDVFRALHHWLDFDTAFDIVVRSKRGFINTSTPGAHTKDIVYLQGYLKVKQHLEEFPEDYNLLFTGKYGLQHNLLVKELLQNGNLILPILLPGNLLGALHDGST